LGAEFVNTLLVHPVKATQSFKNEQLKQNRLLGVTTPISGTPP